MRPLAIVFLAPLLDDLPSVPHRDEPVLVQAFISELAVKALNVRVLLRLAWLDEAQPQVTTAS